MSKNEGTPTEEKPVDVETEMELINILTAEIKERDDYMALHRRSHEGDELYAQYQKELPTLREDRMNLAKVVKEKKNKKKKSNGGE